MASKILLKVKAQILYEKYLKILGSYDCGRNLAHHINPELNKIAKEFDETMDQLSVVDPECPPTRLMDGINGIL